MLLINIHIMQQTKQSILGLFLPKGTLEWFDIVKGESDKNNIYITLEEKNIPPLKKEHGYKTIKASKFYDITITDFPIRGKRSLLTFRRRYWKIEGQKEYLKREIELNFPGTQLEQEFANFLKEDGGRKSGLASFYRRVSANPSQRI